MDPHPLCLDTATPNLICFSCTNFFTILLVVFFTYGSVLAVGDIKRRVRIIATLHLLASAVH